MKHHGEDAPIHAAMNADAMLDKGDLDGYPVWRRVLRAVGEVAEGGADCQDNGQQKNETERHSRSFHLRRQRAN